MYDILIKNGRVMDPGNGFDAAADVAVLSGKIAGVGDFKNAAAERVINAEGHIVTPGLIDIHAHLWPLTKIGISAESACLPGGVTTAIDAGSAGWATYETARGFIPSCRVRVMALVNVSPEGIPADHWDENIDPDFLGGIYEREIMKLFDRYRGELKGIKIRANSGCIKDMGMYPIMRALKLAEKCGTRLVVHAADPGVATAELLKVLRKGDIFAHMYHKTGNTNLLGEDGKVLREAWEARKRGVLFDVGHARRLCDGATAAAAIAEGFKPDLIGTDASALGIFSEHLMCTLPFVLSRMLGLGLSLREAVRAVTATPAEWLGMEGKIGCLSEGAFADVAVFDLKERETVFMDRDGSLQKETQLLKPVATVKDGQVVYRDSEF